ncbi:MAG: hypothetical protein ACREEM_48375 [Blastocatellia bacterium]
MLGRLLPIVIAAGNATSNAALAQGETLQKGQVAVSFTYVRSDTGKTFDFFGNRARIIPPAGSNFRGSSETDVYSTEVAWGLTNKLELHVGIPLARGKVFSIDAGGKVLDTPEQSPSSAGLSNIRFGARYNLVSKPFFLTAKFDAKAPASTPDPERLFSGASLPIREGQWDFDLTGQVSKGLRLFGRPFSIGGEAGIRFRLEQRDGGFDTFTRQTVPVKPANEFIYNFRATYGVFSRLSLSLYGDGIAQGDFDVPFRFARVGDSGDGVTVGTLGKIPVGFKPDVEQQTGRRIFSIGPLATVNLNSRTSVTGGVLFTVAGRNYPAGQFWVISVSRFFR